MKTEYSKVLACIRGYATEALAAVEAESRVEEGAVVMGDNEKRLAIKYAITMTAIEFSLDNAARQKPLNAREQCLRHYETRFRRTR